MMALVTGTSGVDLLRSPLATGSEKQLLHAHLRINREVLLWKLEGLSDQEIRRPMTPTGTNLVGLVKHMTGVEGAYLCDAFDRPRPALTWETAEDAALGEFSDMYATPEETTEGLISDYRAAMSAADRTVEDLELDTLGRHPVLGVTINMRWMLIAVLQDTLRHAGHADIVRELIDGTAGHRPSHPNVLPPEDTAHREQYLARIRGEIDTPTWLAYLRERAR
jgi:hypothetical protein